MKRNNSNQIKEIGEIKSKTSENYLPNINILSDWFSCNQSKKLKRIFDDGYDKTYDKYSVYERYDESKGVI